MRFERRSSMRRQPGRRERRPAAPPTTSADLMGDVLARLGGAGRAREFRVFDCYARVVGDNLRARTQPERLAGTTLYVRVSSSALAHELVLLRGELLERMARELGPDVVVDLRTRVGSVTAEGHAAAASRGPRP